MLRKNYIIPIDTLPVYFYLVNPPISVNESLGPPPVHNPEFRRTFRYYGSFSQDPDIVKVENMKDKYEKDRKLCRIYTMCDQNNSRGTWYHVELMKPNNHQNEIRSHAVSLFEAFQEEADENDFKSGPGYVSKVDHEKINCYLNWIINVENGNIEYYVTNSTNRLSTDQARDQFLISNRCFQYQNIYNHHHSIVRHIRSLRKIVFNNILLYANYIKNCKNMKLFYLNIYQKQNKINKKPIIKLAGGSNIPIRNTIFNYCC